MSNHGDLTTEEVANLLKVSKLTVYDLIKKEELQSYRVGRQIRVKCAALELYKNKDLPDNEFTFPERTGLNEHSIIITGQDKCLDILARQLESKDANYQPLRSQLGSLDGLIAMYHNEADIVSTHLFDGDTGTYNLPYIRKILVSKSFTVIHVLKRDIGFYVAKDNPKKIETWEDLKQPGLQFINRESGAGARILLDEQLRLHQINKDSISGYKHELTSHIDIANAVASGRVDVGIGSLQVAKMVSIDFIPLVEEQYDIVLLHTKKSDKLIQDVSAIMNEPEFINVLHNLGYHTSNTGDVLYRQ